VSQKGSVTTISNTDCPESELNDAVGLINLIIKSEELFNLALGALSVFKACAENDPVDLFTDLEVRVAAARDPNDKVGSQGVADPRYLSGEEPLRYAIFFENQATATAPAQEVVITDQLDMTKMDLSTLSLGPIIFGDRQVVPPQGLKQYSTDVDLRSAKDLIVRIEAGLNSETGIVTWRFTSIDPATGQLTEDPLGGFLPPNVNPPEGDGSVLFTVMPKQGLPTGTEIRNRASIVFDVNQPMDTPEWLNTLDNTKPTSQVLPLAATQCSPGFQVQWSGTDVGSGIQDYTIFVSEDNGPFIPFLSNTTAISATFTGQAGKRYAFYSVARDQTGNLEDTPSRPDTTTQVVADTIPPTTTATPSPAPNGNGWTNSNVTVTLNATDNPGGCGVNDISFSLSGASTGGSVVAGSSAAVTITAEGTTTLTYFARDHAGNQEAPRSLAVQIDKTPPTIVGMPAPNCTLWPPNHSLVQVARVTASDALSGIAPGSPAVSGTSNEPENGLGDGDLSPDVIITGNTVQLRAERSGGGTGRIYTLTATASDLAGNTAQATASCTVPHDQR